MNFRQFFSQMITNVPAETKLLVAHDPAGKVWRASGGGGIVRRSAADGSYLITDPTDPSTFSVSLEDYGITMQDLYERRYGNLAIAAGKRPGSGKQLEQEPEPQLSQRMTERVIQQGQGITTAPLPEIPQDHISAANIAMTYYLKDAVAGPAVRSLYEFVIGPGFDLDLIYTFPVVPDWFDPNAPEVAIAKDAIGEGKASKDKSMSIFRKYMQLEAMALVERLDLESFAVEMSRDALITGGGFGYRVDNIQDEGYLTSWDHEYLWNTPWELQGINPTSVEIVKDEFGVQTALTIRAAGSFGGAGTSIPEQDWDKFIHMKWQGNRYTIYGTSAMQNILEELALKDSLMRAMKASADRYALPIKLARYGIMAPGQDGGPIATPEWKNDMQQALQQFNVATDFLVGPFHWTVDYIGTEHGILNISTEIAECNRRIMMGLSIPPNFLDSNYTSYSTAKIQVANMFLKLRQLQVQTARTLDKGVIVPWSTMRGYRDPNGQVIRFRVNWRRANLEGDPEMLSTIRTLAVNPTQRVASNVTMQKLMGLNPDTERQLFEAEDEESQARFAEMGLDPTGQPKLDPNADPNDPNAKPGVPGAKPGKEENNNKVQNDASQTKKTTAQLVTVQQALAELDTKFNRLEDHFTDQMTDAYAEIRRITEERKAKERNGQ